MLEDITSFLSCRILIKLQLLNSNLIIFSIPTDAAKSVIDLQAESKVDTTDME